MSMPPENCQKLDPMDAMMRLFPQESRVIPGFAQKKGFYSDLHRSILNVDRVERGRVICSLTIDSAVANEYMTLHGGAVASVAEMVSLACVKTVAGDKDFFLGELSTAYLSSARLNVRKGARLDSVFSIYIFFCYLYEFDRAWCSSDSNACISFGPSSLHTYTCLHYLCIRLSFIG